MGFYPTRTDNGFDVPSRSVARAVAVKRSDVSMERKDILSIVRDVRQVVLLILVVILSLIIG